MRVSILSQKPAINMMLTGILLNAILWALVIFIFPHKDATILHYSVDVGIDFIGEGKQITVLPIIGLIIIVGNNLLGLSIYKTNISSAWLAWSIAPIIQIFLIGAFILILLANR